MTDKPRTDQEQWAADLLRLLGFNVKMNYWMKGRAGRMEIDVFGRLGPLQVAIECKKLSKDVVGTSEIKYFHEKLETLGGTLGIFIANHYSEQDLQQCRRFGILPLTSNMILEEILMLKKERVGKKQLPLSNRMWELLGGLMRFAEDWKGYYDQNWPFHKEIYATEAFENHGLIQARRDGRGDFQYECTAKGISFFGHLKGLLDLFEIEGLRPLDRRRDAATILTEACDTRKDSRFYSGYERLFVQALGLCSLDGELMPFGAKLISVLGDAVLSSESNNNRD